GRAAGHAQELDLAVLEDGLGRFQRRIANDRDEIVDADGIVDRLVEKLRSFAGYPGAGRVRVADDCVAAGQHVDDVARQRRQRMRDRSDDADDAERSELGERDAVFPAERLSLEELDARRLLADNAYFLDLVIQPADPRLFQLLTPQLLGLIDADSPDPVDGLTAFVEPASLELALRGRRSGDGGARVVEHAPRPGLAVGRRGLAVAHVRQHFLNDAADQFVGDLHFKALSSQ